VREPAVEARAAAPLSPPAALTVAAGTVLAGAAVLVGPSQSAVAGGILLGFVLPGLALGESLFRGRGLTAVERTALVPALSLAVLVAAGLIIYVAGYPLNRVAWVSATVAVTLAALVAAAVPGGRPAAGDTEPAERPRLRRHLVPLALVLATLGFAGVYSYRSSVRAYDVRVTALSVSPPGTPDATGRRTVDLTATGLVAADGPYSVVISAAGTATTRQTVTVPADGVWTDRLSLSSDRTTISLYRTGETTAYRTLLIAAAGLQ